MKKVLSLTAACALFFVSLASPHVAYAQQNPSRVSISQGEKIYINDTNIACTIGYVDKLKHKAYTADHCLPAHQKSVIYNSNREKIGEAYGRFSDRAMGIAKSRNDVAYINLYDNVRAGGNFYSGSNRVSTTHITPGENLCMFSRKLNSTNCGKVKSVDGTLVVGDEHVNGIGGDSGGPAWIPGKGFVGIYTLIIGGKHFYTSIDDKNCAEGDNSINDNGEVDFSKMCPAGQYAEHSPYVLSRTPLRNPDHQGDGLIPALSSSSSFSHLLSSNLGQKVDYSSVSTMINIMKTIITSILSGKIPYLEA